MKLLAQEGGGRAPLPQGRTAFVWFHDGLELLYVLEVLGPLLFEVARPRDAQSLHAVVPEGVAIALALDQDRISGLARPLKAPETVGKGPTTGFPPEALVAPSALIQSAPEANGFLLSFRVPVRDADRWRARVGNVGEPETFQKLYWQSLGLSVGFEGARRWSQARIGNGASHSSAVAARGKQMAHLQAESLDDLLGGTSRAAEEEDTAVLPLLYVEVRGYPVVVCGAEGPVEAVLGPYAFQAVESLLARLRRRTHDDPPRPPHGTKVSDGGISWLASCAVLAAIILLSLRHFTATGCAPGI